jgi:dethiobiotin synthetase
VRGLLVTGTDTGVGKTEVAVALVAGWRARGLDVAGMKPAQSGFAVGETSDAERLREAAGGGDPLELVCPYALAAPLAPAVAARLEGREVSFAHVVACARSLAARHAALVVEGAGGVLVPLAADRSYADLAAALELPVLVVARAGLGTVNHTALTCEALRARRIAIRGVVLNRPTSATDPSEPYNPAEIERLTGVPVLASLPHVPDGAERVRLFADRLSLAVQF